MARRRRIGGLLSATAASGVSLASVFLTHTAVVAAGECNIEIPAIITYSNYNKLMKQRQDCEAKAVEAKKQQAVLDEYAEQVLSGICNGYVMPFVEHVFVSLYGEAAVQEQWTNRVQGVFLDTMLDVLNECTDDCVIVDSLELELLEKDTFSVGEIFSGGNGRYLADLGDELYMADDGETMTSTYLLANAANGTAAATAGEEGRQLQDSKRKKTSDRRRKSRGKRNVAKLKARGRNSSGRRASLLSKRGKTSDVIKGGGDGRRHLEEADAGECGELLMERLADTGIDIFKCIANVELTSYNPVQCIAGQLINTITGDAIDEMGRSPQQTQGQSETIMTAQVEDEDKEVEVPAPRGRNRPRD